MGGSGFGIWPGASARFALRTRRSSCELLASAERAGWLDAGAGLLGLPVDMAYSALLAGVAAGVGAGIVEACDQVLALSLSRCG